MQSEVNQEENLNRIITVPNLLSFFRLCLIPVIIDAHDEEPHVITIQEVEKRYSPWSSKIYSMRNTIIK